MAHADDSKATNKPRARGKPMTDEELAEAYVGPLHPFANVIRIVEYDPAWPKLFEREAERIRGALGDQVLLLEHVGSTSVPGLAAKPTIDILLVIDDSANEAAYLPRMEAAGYILRVREPNRGDHRMFKGPDTSIHLHVFSRGSPEIERMLLFRDRLRANEADRALYEQTKRELAKRRWKYGQNYADAKSEVVEAILSRARQAAAGSGGL